MFDQYGEESHIQGQTINHSREDDHSYPMENNQLSHGKCPSNNKGEWECKRG